jgi:hypothetical protein
MANPIQDKQPVSRRRRVTRVYSSLRCVFSSLIPTSLRRHYSTRFFAAGFVTSVCYTSIAAAFVYKHNSNDNYEKD